MSDIVTALDLAQQKNEQQLAQEINPPTPRLDDSESLLILRTFADYCRWKGCKWLPAAPSTVAAWMRLQHANRIPAKTIKKAVEAIEAAHDQHGFSNPIATASVRAELTRILHINPPRSWPAADKLKFAELPIEIRLVIERRAEQDSLALRRLQNKVAAISKPKETTSDDTQTSD